MLFKRGGNLKRMSMREKVIKALKKVYDPEIPINIYDLGLVYGVEVYGSRVKVRMTLTAPGCPMAAYLPALVEEVIKQEVPEAEDVEVEVVWDPPWSPRRVTEEGRRRLREIFGRDIVEEWIRRVEERP
ncbi:MAG: PaaD family metal-sulfur cluster biosynthetic protein [Thermoprotei archaeon]|nr:MAG: PaaD family metal-sulfur cluster biosynthetic protein [Thermoprotei archaeon]RLE96311.1 MAG: PaaD family metal-sulfur cluster biosynthetic protein [Thermoprotei archaeon]